MLRMATLRTFLHASLLFLNFSFFTNAQTASLSSYLLDLRPRASSTTTALDCSQTTSGNVSTCYPSLNLIPTCCVCLAPPEPSHQMSREILTTSPLVAAMPCQHHPPTALCINRH